MPRKHVDRKILIPPHLRMKRRKKNALTKGAPKRRRSTKIKRK